MDNTRPQYNRQIGVEDPTFWKVMPKKLVFKSLLSLPYFTASVRGMQCEMQQLIDQRCIACAHVFRETVACDCDPYVSTDGSGDSHAFWHNVDAEHVKTWALFSSRQEMNHLNAEEWRQLFNDTSAYFNYLRIDADQYVIEKRANVGNLQYTIDNLRHSNEPE